MDVYFHKCRIKLNHSICVHLFKIFKSWKYLIRFFFKDFSFFLNKVETRKSLQKCQFPYIYTTTLQNERTSKYRDNVLKNRRLSCTFFNSESVRRKIIIKNSTDFRCFSSILFSENINDFSVFGVNFGKFWMIPKIVWFPEHVFKKFAFMNLLIRMLEYL